MSIRAIFEAINNYYIIHTYFHEQQKKRKTKELTNLGLGPFFGSILRLC